MTVKRLILALPVLALLAGCGDDAASGDGRAASGEVLEGTISDAMLPVDRVRSEPPLADPAAFAQTRGGASESGETTDGDAAEPEADAAGPAPEITVPALDD